MTFSTTPDADPDPTTQIAWPGARSKPPVQDVNTSGSTLADEAESRELGERRKSSRSGKDRPGKRRLKVLDLFNLSVSMGGAQIAWTVELGYGTPFLLSLGLSEQMTSLVWLAGPISGLIAQPIIGAISDSSTSKYRRRYWIVSSTIVLVISTLVLAYCQDMASMFVDLFHGGEGDWDPKRNRVAANTAIGLAVVSFYLLDFALNALQASLRNLLLDITPSDQLSAGNAWHSRMTQIGNVVGFGFGFIPLAKLPLFKMLGGSQFRKFCVVAIAVLVITVWITCFTQVEERREATHKHQGKLRDILNNIYTAIINLPTAIRRVCYVQLFAFMGWFPFLFYSTTYVGQIMAYELQAEPDEEVATRIGALAMLIYSIVAIGAGALLPHLARRDPKLLAHEDDEDEEAEFLRLRSSVQRWRMDAIDRRKALRLPRMPLLLKDIWLGALLLFTAITFSTFFVSTVWQAIIAVSFVGICWAVACWVPFAIIMEFLKDMDSKISNNRPPPTIRSYSGRTSSETTPDVEEEPLVRPDEDEPLIDTETGTPVAGGTILGVHNLAIVMPQFIVALVSSAIFHAVDGEDLDPERHTSYYGKNGVAWVLRFGGLCTLFAAVATRLLPLTRTEKEMKRRLGVMQELVRQF